MSKAVYCTPVSRSSISSSSSLETKKIQEVFKNKEIKSQIQH